MNPNTTPRALRANITFVGCRNAGKSSLINAIVGQEVSIVSSVAGTTTDAVAKAYELLPLGPVTFYDTAGLDDEGSLGDLRIKATKKILFKTDIAVVVISENGISAKEKEIINEIRQQKIPFIVAFNKSDLHKVREQDLEYCKQNDFCCLAVSATDKNNIEELKNLIIQIAPAEFKQEPLLVGDLIKAGDSVVLVVPIDLSAPKGRLILPQVQTLREILDANAVATVCKENDLATTLANMNKPAALIITDSQVVMKVAPLVDDAIPFTTFSTLFARYKGDFEILLRGSQKIDELKEGDKVLIAEACSHHVQPDDIGTVKIPNWLQKYCNCHLQFDFYSGCDFPDNLEQYDLVIHCGACMLGRAEMVRRLKECERRGVAVTNYGLTISKTQGLLERVCRPLQNQMRSKAAL